MQQLHVSGVGSAAIEHLRCPVNPPHDLRKGSILKIGKALAWLILLEAGKKYIPQPLHERARL